MTHRDLPLYSRWRAASRLLAGTTLVTAMMATSVGCGDSSDPNPVAPGPLTSTAPLVTLPSATSPLPSGNPLPTTAPLPDTNTQPEEACVGVDPEASAALLAAKVTARQDEQPNPDQPEPECTKPLCIGDDAPYWELHDYQPQSCGYDRDYGINTFNGKVTMVVFLSGW